MKKISLIVMMALSLGMTFQDACAQVLIEDARISLKVKPGSTVVDTLRVHNTANKALELKIYWQDFKYIPPFDGAKEFMPAGTATDSFHEWMSFSPIAIRIPPFGKKEINYTIKIPPSAKGGYQGVLFFETKPTQPQQGEIGLSIVTRVGAIFFLRTAGDPKIAGFAELKVAQGIFRGVFQNKSSMTLFPEAVYYVMDETGIVVDRGEIKKIYLPAGSEAGLDVPMSGKLKPGTYSAVVTFDLEDGDSMVKEFDFVKNDDQTLKIIRVRD